MVEIEGLTDVQEVGRGGFGVVYRATQPAFHRHVAVKVLADRFDAVTQARFEREGAAMGALSGHPNILVVHGAGVAADGRPYLVMPFLERGSLGARLAQEGALPWTDVVAIGVRVAGALETAHAAGILHRDIKPDNILLDDYGEPQVCDFGIARFHGGAGTATQTGRVTASVLYAAPEVLAGQPASPASDLYSLGATLYTLLAGRPAFASESDESLVPFFYRVTTQPVPWLAQVPDQVTTVIARAMAKEPADRHPSAAAFATALQDVQRALGKPVTTLSLSTRTSTRTTPAAIDSDRTRRVGQVTPAAPVPATALAPEPTVVGPPARAPVAPPAARPRRRGGLIVAGVGIVAALAVGGFLLLDGNGDGRGTQAAATAPSDGATPAAGTAVAASDPVAVGDGLLGDGALRIGLLVPPGVPPLAGTTDELVEAAARAAVADVNAAGGVFGQDIELAVVGGGIGQAAIDGLAALLNDGRNDVLIGGDPLMDPVLLTATATTAQRLLISPLVHAIEFGSNDGGLVFRTSPPDLLEGVALVQDAGGRGVTDLVVVAEETNYGFALAAQVEEALAARGIASIVVGYPPGDLELFATRLEEVPLEQVAIAAFVTTGLPEVIATIVAADFDFVTLLLPPSAARSAGQLRTDLDPAVLADFNTVVFGHADGDPALAARLAADGAEGVQLGVRATYDAVVIAALGATAAGTDEPFPVADRLSEVTSGGEPCATYADCLALLADGADIDYEPPDRPLDLDVDGNPADAAYVLDVVGPDGSLERGGTIDTRQR